MAKEVEKEAVAKEAAEKEAKTENKENSKKFVYGPKWQKQFIHVGEKSARIDVPVGKDAEGKLQCDKYFVPKGWLKDDHIAAPVTHKQNDISVIRFGAEKSEPVKDINDLFNASRAIQVKTQKKSLKVAPKKEAEKAAEKGGRGE